MIALGSFGQSGQQGRVNPHRDSLPWSVSGRLSSALGEPVDVIATFGFVCPALDVVLGDRLALCLLHTNRAIRNPRRPPLWLPQASLLMSMSTKAERQAAREAVGAYHEAQLPELIRHVGEVVDRFRAGELTAFEIGRAIFQYSRAAQELWKFCNSTDAMFTAAVICERAPTDWWERGAPKLR